MTGRVSNLVLVLKAQDIINCTWLYSEGVSHRVVFVL